MIDPSQLGQAAAGFGILAGGVFGGYQAWKARKGADRAAEHAYPISNGWGTQLRNDMAQQRQDMAAQREDTAAVRRTVERMAEAQLLAERRDLERDREQAELRALLQAHLLDHAKETVA